MLKDIVKGGIALSASSVFVLILSLFYTPIIARILGPEGLGALNLAILVTSWLIPFSSFSLEATTVKYISELKAKKRDISPVIRDSFLLASVSGFFGTVLYYYSADFIAQNIFHDPSLGHFMRLASPLVFISVLCLTSLGVLRGLKMFGKCAMIGSIKQLLLVVIGLMLVVYFRIGVNGAIIALILSPLLIVAYLLYRFRAHFSSREAVRLKPLVDMGFWLVIVSTFVAFLSSMDRLFLGYFESTEIVGLYTPALTIVSAISLFGLSIRKSAFPFMSEAIARNDLVSARQCLESTIKYSLVISGFFLIVAMALRSEIILLFFGMQFMPSVDIFMVLLFLPLVTAFYNIFGTFLTASGVIKRVLIPVFSAIFVSLVANALLVPNFHAVGAAFAIIISFFALTAGLIILVKEKIDFSLNRAIMLVLIISIFMILNIYLMSGLAANILLSIVSVALYVVFLYVFRIFDKDEMDFVQRKLGEWRKKCMSCILQVKCVWARS